MRPGNSDPVLQGGQTLGGCVVDCFVARGGMGDVYKARKVSLDCDVALKVLHPDLVADDRVRSRFLREARVAASLTHPSIVKVYDVGEDQGLHFIVMEFVEGSDLRNLVGKEGRLAVGTALRIVRQVADALDYAHKRGVIHRDVKPANIILSSDGVAKLADLGLARPAQEDCHLTIPGEIVGTPVYMSPEQYRGDSIDGRSDLYSLGSTLYMLVSGKPPFRGESTAALVQKVLYERPRPLQAQVPGIPDGVVALVQRLMAKHPSARFQTGREVVMAINDILVGRAATTREDPEEEGTADRALQLARWSALLAISVALGLGLYLTLPALDQLLRPSSGADALEVPAQPGSDTGTTNHPGNWTHNRLSGGEDRPAIDTGRNDPSRAAVNVNGSARVSDAELRRDIDRFRHAIMTADGSAVFGSFHPSNREDAALKVCITAFLERVSLGRLEPGVYVAQQLDPNRAKVLFLFRDRDEEKSVGLPVEWSRIDGRWYVEPILQAP